MLINKGGIKIDIALTLFKEPRENILAHTCADIFIVLDSDESRKINIGENEEVVIVEPFEKEESFTVNNFVLNILDSEAYVQ